ncbi:hypothetical protein SAMN05216374_0759 [Tardiphaga sp. OK246]|jgi:hypothetical protein|uniref:DUF2076 domain-containing protein n=1 Tax=Tardiphaga sp. OK246 TaxID=1855307 RepID=UPI000B764C26|nr:DUF2076 domain-containing protein [Tardiphaga sp. OK246]SNS31063.1 hypothetical protein SAMN05216374_0759 [Tardiphaga sp. OK246]
MTPQERQLVDDLFDRLSKVEGAPRDPDALDAIAQGQRRAPNAVYALVQTVLLQDEALKRAHERIQQLEGNGAPEQAAQGGFLDSMRDALFGQGQSPNQPRGSVPSVRPPEPSRPAWNTGQVIGQPQPQGGYGQGGYGQGPGPGQFGQQQPQAGGGGSFLGTAAAAAAGVVGGSLLLGSIRSMMGGSHQQGFGDAANASESKSPWSSGSDSSGGNLGNQAGVNDIGSSSGSRAGSFDQAQADADQDQDQDQDDGDYDAMDMDSDDSDLA